ncbi:MAG: 50S ribosomal protein L21 [Candidatus Magasanikbacteria bacterium RIFCSPHIGHO2_01_FULL_50_8]|uniref:Large ribosomal subunit protein bL21 n=1 Tax=Candidatus Magasanikbacteria bacterium RIFCSPHIGHO2_01_FULL_50_8 TaxID=1798674 RepID=A0A1F6LQ39_9BACT|nr:MAG: 50S ribosomal protein L21 [Candidatus Magasanikbacteria bacterium RIFCSPHIGHO2_01_FULL_50_8]
MIAIIETGGKQYLVTPNQKITTEKTGADAGAALTFDKVLLVADENGANVQIGTPTVSATVEGTLLRNFRTRKIMVRKFKNKVRYRRTAGHRQHQTEENIGSIK